jgi:hypothetical protein
MTIKIKARNSNQDYCTPDELAITLQRHQEQQAKQNKETTKPVSN